jgi:amidohydrolase
MNTNELKNKIQELARKYAADAVSDRRYLHSIPEMGFEEFKTSAYLIEKLTKYGVSFKQGVAKTGILGMIETGKPAKVIALRADMDALPITEINEDLYKSMHSGYMHACGHDVHMACLLGTARILNELKAELKGTVKFIFQPSEETFPGGALAMIREGVLENPHVDNVIGMHVLPTLDAGKAGFKSGKYMASTDELYLTVKGKGGHAATPELVVNPLIIASEILIELNKYFKDKSHDTDPYVLSFGRIMGEGRTNIVPDEVTIDGTLRAYKEKWRVKAHEIIKKMSSEIAEKSGGLCELRIAHGYPFLKNDPDLTDRLFNSSIEILGNENVCITDMRLTAEDFAYYSLERPSCFYRLGTKSKSSDTVTNLHTNTFNVDEAAIETGIALMTWLAVSELMR